MTLAAYTAIFGPFPEHMLEHGPLAPQYFGQSGALRGGSASNTEGETLVGAAVPRNTSLRQWLRGSAAGRSGSGASPDSAGSGSGGGLGSGDADSDSQFMSFVSDLLQLDPNERPSAEDALQHPWMQHVYEQ